MAWLRDERRGLVSVNIQEALAIVRREMLWTYENIIYTQRHEREIIPGMRDAWDHPTIVEQRGEGDCDDKANVANRRVLVAIPVLEGSDIAAYMVIGTVPVRNERGQVIQSGHAWSSVRLFDADWHFDAAWGLMPRPLSWYRHAGRIALVRRRWIMEQESLGP